MSKTVYIVSAARTPIGSFNGALANIPAPRLAATAIKGALEKAGVNADAVDEVFIGNVISANVGQAPARQASIYAGIPYKVPCTTVNKVCASGTKAVMLGANQIRLGLANLVVAGGMENMSAVPHYIQKSRTGTKLGHMQVLDGILRDALWDIYSDHHMGNAGEICAEGCNISREEQDEFAIESYKRALKAIENGWFKDEIVPVEIPQRKGDPVIFDTDEEPGRVRFDKIPGLRPVFKKGGTITAANASPINDGAAAVILASEEAIKQYGLTPIAKIVADADAAKEPDWFTTAPSDALPKALSRAGLSVEDIDAFEINQAFSVVSIANEQILKLDRSKVDIFGGAVALGHPVGCSGTRILVTLLSTLKHVDGKYGALGICNGGGGASAMVIERL